MDKQELIKMIQNEMEDRKGKVRLFPEIRKSENAMIKALETILSMVELLDEPKKVKVPVCVDKYLNFCMKMEMSLTEALKKEKKSEGFGPFKFIDEALGWLESSMNQNIFADAWLNGWETEEEPRWTVKVKGHYLMHLEYPFDDMTLSDVVSFTTDSKKEADAVAFLAKGAVEKV